MWLAMVAMQHKNKGLYYYQHAASFKYINPTQISVFNKCLVLTITTFKMMGMVMRYCLCPLACKFWLEVVSSGGAPTPAGTSVFTKHNWDLGMGYLWLNGWGIYHLMGGAFMAYWVGHL